MSVPAQRRAPRSAFTLVELLVVIGIIAVLIGILLPALGAARRQANTVKCATALREIGNAFQLYAIDNKGWYPPSQIAPPIPKSANSPAFASYEVNGLAYPNSSGVGAFWFNFLAKYVTKTKTGVESANPSDTSEQRSRSLFWACPAWEGYYTGSGAGGGYNRIQTGYGMNCWPTFRPDYPKTATMPPNSEASCLISGILGTFYKQIVWTRNGGATRALIGDSRFWLLDANPPPANGPYPPAVVAQPMLSNNTTYTNVAGQTTVDLYRHGKHPGTIAGGNFDPWGGKIAYNVLYCDGHVATATRGDEAYKSIRMKFPG